MTAHAIPAIVVNHVALDMAASPDTVWRAILDEYVDAAKFREMGCTIEPLDDPAALPGSYRMRLEQDGAVVDDRIVRITERDNAARRLSLFADYLAEPGGLQVHATYHARQIAGGTRYALDCHTQLGAAAEQDVRQMRAESEAYLIDYLQTIRARVEGAG
jgi:hypothetical protein